MFAAAAAVITTPEGIELPLVASVGIARTLTPQAREDAVSPLSMVLNSHQQNMTNRFRYAL